jgi:hypothetical protein
MCPKIEAMCHGAKWTASKSLQFFGPVVVVPLVEVLEMFRQKNETLQSFKTLHFEADAQGTQCFNFSVSLETEV